MISSWDDFPVHQTPEPVRHVGTSDRNFYDRYYFNLHGSSDELFAIFGLGVYPNLGVKDAFLAVTAGGKQRIVRASDELSDRSDISVGPIRIEVLEPLQKLLKTRPRADMPGFRLECNVSTGTDDRAPGLVACP